MCKYFKVVFQLYVGALNCDEALMSDDAFLY